MDLIAICRENDPWRETIHEDVKGAMTSGVRTRIQMSERRVMKAMVPPLCESDARADYRIRCA